MMVPYSWTLLSFVILTSAAVTQGFFSTANAVSVASVENWKATGLSLEFGHKTIFRNSSCQLNERNFTGCLVAIDAMERALETEATSLSKYEFETYSRKASALYREGPEKFNFEAKIEALRKTLAKTNARAEAFVTSRGINFYYAAVKDPHTRVVPAKDDYTHPTFVGIGVQPRSTEAGQVLTPLANSPAFKAGVRKGDVLVGVDQLVAGKDSEEKLIQAIGGELGTFVTLKVKRLVQAGEKFDEKIIQIRVRRQIVAAERVRFEKLEQPSGKTALIVIDSFAKHTCKSVRRILERLDRTYSGIILDLRSNPGGFVSEATCVSSLFIGPDRLAISYVTSERNSVSTTSIMTLNEQKSDLPLAILTNSETISAAELVAGTLQHYERAWLVGERTFGKGSYQDQLETALPGLTFSFTGGLYLLPDGRSPQLVGVLPDFEIYPTPLQSEETSSTRSREDQYPHVIASTHQAYIRPRNIIQRRAIRACVQNKNPTREFERTIQQLRAADLQLLTAIDVLSCHETEKAPLTLKTAQALVREENCNNVPAYFSYLEAQISEASNLDKIMRTRLAGHPEYFRSLDYYRTQWRFSELDIADELAAAKSEIMTLAGRCHLTAPPLAP